MNKQTYRQHNNNQGAPNQNNQNQNKQNGPQQQQRNNRPNPLKFENEFDFESANSKFEEVRAQFQRLKVVGIEEVKAPDQVNKLLLFSCLTFGRFFLTNCLKFFF